MNDFLKKEKAEWSDWAVWVVKTVEQLVDRVQEQDKEFFKFQRKLLIDLLKLKEELRGEMETRCNRERKSLNGIITNLDELIEDLRTRTRKLETVDCGGLIDKKLSTLKEDVLFPLKLKVAILSVVGGAVGGAVVPFLFVVLWSVVQKALSGS